MCIYVLHLFLNNVGILVFTIYIKIYNIKLCQAKTTSIHTYLYYTPMYSNVLCFQFCRLLLILQTG